MLAWKEKHKYLEERNKDLSNKLDEVTRDMTQLVHENEKHMMLSIYTYLSKKSLKNVRKELESFNRYGLSHRISQSSMGNEYLKKIIFINKND